MVENTAVATVNQCSVDGGGATEAPRSRVASRCVSQYKSDGDDEHVVTQLHQEVITLEAPLADQTGFVEAVRAINNLATAQVRKGTPSLINV